MWADFLGPQLWQETISLRDAFFDWLLELSDWVRKAPSLWTVVDGDLRFTGVPDLLVFTLMTEPPG